MEKPITNFDEAFRELQEIAREIEDQGLPVETLSRKVDRAAELTRFCKTRLREIETELKRFEEDDLPEN
jgi:exodeoxyribonuclease VII small subunit